MPILIVVREPDHWPLSIPGVEVVGARRYLTDPTYHRMANTRVFNLCRSYSYQSLGYYVSLLAEAREHKPEPDIMAIQDMKSSALVRAISEDMDELIQQTLRPLRSDDFSLSIYFGKTLAQRDAQLGRRLFGRFRSPLLRAYFVRDKLRWQLRSVRPIPTSEIPPTHHAMVVAAAEEYFRRRQRYNRLLPLPRYYLAVLHDPGEDEPPSDQVALRKFMRAARHLGVGAELITRDDYARLGEYDALFIRTTTFVNHYTYRFARRAAAEGMAVIDDPMSIARCTNKVYMAELLALHRIPTPRTVIVQKDNIEEAAQELGFPVVLKQPDSAFSKGVSKLEDLESYRRKVEELLEDSDVVVAQAYMPSAFDWRVGVLDGEPLYVCKYYMAPRHWQIMHWQPDGKPGYGRTETLPVEQAPPRIVRTAVRAARLIGDGLYGVDLKLVGDRAYVIEINDNPTIESGVEDQVLKDDLYERIIRSFIRRIELIREGVYRRVRRANGGTV
ncbi:MAG: RimK family protein [Phycisphaerales bacterium]|nr:RimK family protein [Phycisphaerales bacterium]